MRLEGATVAVTGGANGIGAAICREVAHRGASAVAVLDLDEAGARRVAEEIAAGGVVATAASLDVSRRDDVERVLGEVEDALGPIEVMVSNAGIGTGAGIEADVEVWDRAWGVNVLAHVHAARVLLPGMLERGGGAFVHTCSAAGLLTMIGDAPYAVSKHAAVAFAEWLSVTYGDRGIQVAALCPQGVETDLLRSGAGAVAEAVVRSAGVVLDPGEVARVVADAVEDGRFLVLPHPEVAEHYRRRADDPERWLASMRRLASRVDAG